MSILGSIIDIIFTHPKAGQPTDQPTATATSANDTPPSAPRSDVDIDAVMDALAAERGEPLDWKHSVVDLLKTVGLDSSREARVRLAKELHYTGDLSLQSSKMNEWLHDKVLRAIEDNGGKLPEDLK